MTFSENRTGLLLQKPLRALHLFCLALSLSWPLWVQAVSPPREVLHIGTMDLKPYGWLDDSGHGHGPMYQLSEEIGRRSGQPFTNEVLPFKRLQYQLRTGHLDRIISQAHQETLRAGDELAAIFRIRILLPTNKKTHIRTLNDLQGKTVAIHDGASYPQLDALHCRLRYVSDYRQAFLVDFLRQDISGAVISAPALAYLMTSLHLSKQDFGPIFDLGERTEWVFVRHDLPSAKRLALKQIVTQLDKEDKFNQFLQLDGFHSDVLN